MTEMFLQDLEACIRDTDLIPDFLERVSKSLPGRWVVRKAYHEPVLFGLDVKNKGFGDFDKVNKDNRWEDLGLTGDDYYDILRGENEILFEDWCDRFFNQFGLKLIILGRMGGYWGFKVEDLDDFNGILKINEAVVAKYLEAGYEEAEEVFDNMETSDLDNLIELDPTFKEYLVTFTEDIQNISNERETDEYADRFYNDCCADFEGIY